MEGDRNTTKETGVPNEISIHSLRMEGDTGMIPRDWEFHISIHSLRMEGDGSYSHKHGSQHISIHSLRMEGDLLREVGKH